MISNYDRQLIEPRFDQGALANPASCLVQPGRDNPVCSLFMLLASAMGVEQQMLLCSDRAQVDLDVAVRAMRLNPRFELRPVSPELGVTLNRAALRTQQRPYLLVDVTRSDRRWRRQIDAATSALPEAAVRFYADRIGGVVSGTSASEVLKRARGLGPPAGALPGAHVNVATAQLLADYLAHVGAWSPSDDRPMPPAPELTIRRSPPNRSVPRGLKLLLVGGGGALAHAFLEAMLRDPILRDVFAQIVIVDYDRYEASNLNRQTLASPEGLGKPKAEVTIRSLADLWGEESARPRLIPIVDRISSAHVQGFAPDVVGLFADNAEARSVAYEAVLSRPGTIVLYGGTEFTYAVVRVVQVGGRGPCLNCGPESLAEVAARERQRNEQRASCGHEITSSNVLSNAVAGALCAEQLRHWLALGTVEPRQHLVNWRLPERVTSGPLLPGCSCGQQARKAS
jgi:molybdopterin/thiamine biosynthesis adenylyltransferase